MWGTTLKSYTINPSTPILISANFASFTPFIIFRDLQECVKYVILHVVFSNKFYQISHSSLFVFCGKMFAAIPPVANASCL